METIENALGLTRTGVAIVWIAALLVIAVLREMAHHCSAYDEEHSIARARVVRGVVPQTAHIEHYEAFRIDSAGDW